MMRRSIALLAFVLLAACGASEAPAAAPPTQAATQAPTAGPLDNIDLEPLLIQSGDLPAGVTGAQMLHTVPQGYTDVRAAAKITHQLFQRNGGPAGSALVFLFDNTVDRDKGYVLINRKGYEPQEGIGEQAALLKPTKVLPVYGVVFIRCHALVNIRMDQVEANQLIAYAKRLDKRLSTVVC